MEAEVLSTLDEDEFKAELGALGYQGFSYLRGKSHYNPARLLFLALDQDSLDRRVVEALPWLAYTYPGMDWEWLTRNAKLNDRQNRLGFVVDLAEEVAEKAGATRPWLSRLCDYPPRFWCLLATEARLRSDQNGRGY